MAGFAWESRRRSWCGLSSTLRWWSLTCGRCRQRGRYGVCRRRCLGYDVRSGQRRWRTLGPGRHGSASVLRYCLYGVPSVRWTGAPRSLRRRFSLRVNGPSRRSAGSWVCGHPRKRCLRNHIPGRCHTWCLLRVWNGWDRALRRLWCQPLSGPHSANRRRPCALPKVRCACPVCRGETAGRAPNRCCCSETVARRGVDRRATAATCSGTPSQSCFPCRLRAGLDREVAKA